MLLQLSAGFLLALLIASAARRARALSRSGAIAATLLGAAFFGLGGLGWAALLLAFFISSSLLSRLFKRRKQALDEKFSKGAERDAAQVLANGGVAGLFAIAHAFFPNAHWPWIGCAAALAAANADTWATELGVLNPGRPVLITSFRPVERGTSGGISLVGTLAALGGSALVALIGVLFWQSRAGLRPDWLASDPALLLAIAPVSVGLKSSLLNFVILTVCGLLGSLVDSLLGAVAQAIYYCPACAKETERHPLHTCGARTRLARGLAWLDNDWVNAACTLSAALAALLLLAY